MERCPTRWVVTWYTSAALLLADFTHFLITRPGNRGDALAGLEGLGVCEFDLGSEDGAGYVDPIVVCRPLQRFPGVYRSAEFLLEFSVEIGCLLGRLLLQPFALALLFGFLLMRYLGRLHKVMLGSLDRT